MSTEYLYGWRFEPNDSGIPYLTYNFENPSIQIKQNFTVSFSLSHPLQKKKLAILQFSYCFVSFTTLNPHNTPEYTHN